MSYPKSVIKLAHDNAEAVCMRSARAIHEAGIKSFREIPLADLALRLRVTFDEQVRYLEHQDMDAWQKYSAEIVEDRIRRGMNASDVIQAGQIMLSALREFFASELGKVHMIEGREASKILERLEARIQGMNAIATAVATRVGVTRHK